jgi:hypothetical protein
MEPKDYFKIGKRISVITSTVTDTQSVNFEKLASERFDGELLAYNPYTDSIIIRLDNGRIMFIKEYRRVLFNVTKS